MLTDLKQRGMLDDTLVIWGGEFGRTPTVELPTPGSNAGKINGRDHNHYGFTMWLAGGGVKGGYVHGATDEFGFQAVENKVHVHDLHATILHLLGFDHEKLTYRYAGRDFRLTDVHGFAAGSFRYRSSIVSTSETIRSAGLVGGDDKEREGWTGVRDRRRGSRKTRHTLLVLPLLDRRFPVTWRERVSWAADRNCRRLAVAALRDAAGLRLVSFCS